MAHYDSRTIIIIILLTCQWENSQTTMAHVSDVSVESHWVPGAPKKTPTREFDGPRGPPGDDGTDGGS